MFCLALFIFQSQASLVRNVHSIVDWELDFNNIVMLFTYQFTTFRVRNDGCLLSKCSWRCFTHVSSSSSLQKYDRCISPTGAINLTSTQVRAAASHVRSLPQTLWPFFCPHTQTESQSVDAFKNKRKIHYNQNLTIIM